MKYQDIISKIKDKIYYPVYFLTGEEEYYIDKISDCINNHILSDTEKEFNQRIFYGKEIDIETIIAESKQYPFGSNYRVIIIKEAQHLKKIEKLEQYLQNPQTTTILVICYKNKKIDKRKKIWKNLTETCILFESRKTYQEKIPDWIKGFCKERDYQIEEKSAYILSEYLGNDLSKIKNELNKLIINLKKEETISPTMIEKYIGISKDYNIFELQSAIGKKDIIKSNKIIQYFSENSKKNPFALVISSLFSYFQKIMIYHSLKNTHKENIYHELGIHPYFLNQYKLAAKNYQTKKLYKIFSYLKEYDLKSKGINNNSTSDSKLLRELIFKILN